MSVTKQVLHKMKAIRAVLREQAIRNLLFASAFSGFLLMSFVSISHIYLKEYPENNVDILEIVYSKNIEPHSMWYSILSAGKPQNEQIKAINNKFWIDNKDGAAYSLYKLLEVLLYSLVVILALCSVIFFISSNFISDRLLELSANLIKTSLKKWGIVKSVDEVIGSTLKYSLAAGAGVSLVVIYNTTTPPAKIDREELQDTITLVLQDCFEKGVCNESIDIPEVNIDKIVKNQLTQQVALESLSRQLVEAGQTISTIYQATNRLKEDIGGLQQDANYRKFMNEAVMAEVLVTRANIMKFFPSQPNLSVPGISEGKDALKTGFSDLSTIERNDFLCDRFKESRHLFKRIKDIIVGLDCPSIESNTPKTGGTRSENKEAQNIDNNVGEGNNIRVSR